jgi:hypothetical protein
MLQVSKLSGIEYKIFIFKEIKESGYGGACSNPSYVGGRDRRIEIQNWSIQRLESLSEKLLKKRG